MKIRLIYTIGHSTHPIDRFIEMLKNFQIDKLIDVRTIPRSRFNPQFNKESLSKVLQEQSIGYEHFPGLGGLRHSKVDSLNKGWRNKSFRGYADYMQTEEFEKNIQKLMTQVEKCLIAVMCAESVPWRCHRSLIADALLNHGFKVKDIMAPGKATLHQMNPMAKILEGKIYYPLDESENREGDSSP